MKTIRRTPQYKPSYSFAILFLIMMALFFYARGLFAQSNTVQGASDRGIVALYNTDYTNPPSYIVVYQNYPNPFTNTTTIKFENSSFIQVKLAIYDANGNLVKAYIYDNLQPGIHEVMLDGNNLDSGEYTYRFTSGTYSQEYKMNLVK